MPVDPKAFDGSESDTDRAVLAGIESAFEGMDDDFNTAIAIAELNNIGSYVHKIANQQLAATELSPWVLEKLKLAFHTLLFDVFGLAEEDAAGDDGTVDGLMNLILELRANARTQKDWAASDKIRDVLGSVGILVKDGKEGVTWSKG